VRPGPSGLRSLASIAAASRVPAAVGEHRTNGNGNGNGNGQPPAPVVGD
jgi:hypothetical protein